MKLNSILFEEENILSIDRVLNIPFERGDVKKILKQQFLPELKQYQYENI